MRLSRFVHPYPWIRRRLWIVVCGLLIVAPGCGKQATVEQDSSVADAAVATDASLQPSDSESQGKAKKRRRKMKYVQTLSEYGLFTGDLVDHRPAEGVVKYELNSTLFTDYAAKQRFVRLPAGTSAPYTADGPFDFPVGTVIAKTFAHDNDMNDPSKGQRNVETRILLHQENGWIGLPYIWDEQQSEATLSLTGGKVDVQWVHYDGQQREISHIVPNVNDCKRCHVDNKPIGPQTKHINREFAYEHGPENQLAHWSEVGILSGAPDPKTAPRLAIWNDESSGSVEERARAWLDINCAHCHSETGPARNSGLHLYADVTDPFRLGVFKGPVAAGKGTGGRRFDIVPGKPDESILMYRMETTHPGEVMPEFGRSVIDVEANELIRQWIENMEVEEGETAAATGHAKALSSK
jgi:uncharacterized repeat protein (TIGR03806 family)